MSPTAYNSFRYGLVMLYLGTLLVVIGYHNSWISFVRYAGFVMAAAGMSSMIAASWKSCSSFAREQAVSVRRVDASVLMSSPHLRAPDIFVKMSPRLDASYID